MIRYLNLPAEEFNLGKSLLYVCKKTRGHSDVQPEIDFLLLQKQIQQMNQVQSKTCQKIVEFVDEHHQEFIKINQHFQEISDSIVGSEMVLKSLLPKIDAYKAENYGKQNSLENLVGGYQKNMMQKQLFKKSKQEAQFLIQFVHGFDHFINTNLQDISERSKYLIVRLLHKKNYIKSIFQHPYTQSATTDHVQILNLLDNIIEEFQFYLSQQLSRICLNKQICGIDCDGITLLEEIKIWYNYLGKQKIFYETVEQIIINKSITPLQKQLIANKQSPTTHVQPLALNFFQKLSELISDFPTYYPQERILIIIYSILTKKQLSFLYAPVGSTFPTFYSAYKSQLIYINRDSIRKQLTNHHGWNLRFWADLRVKSIMDRSSKEKEFNLNKWIEIIFKKNFMLEGVKSYMIKLAFQLIDKYTILISEQPEFSVQSLNQTINQIFIVPQTLYSKLIDAYEGSLTPQTEANILKVKENSVNILKETITKWTVTHTEMLIQSCKGSLQSYKSFVMKIASNKKQKNKTRINKIDVLLKPLQGFYNNNAELSEQSKQFLKQVVVQEILHYYDEQYAKDIFNHCQTNQLTVQKMKNVMDAVSLERNQLFEDNQ